MKYIYTYSSSQKNNTQLLATLRARHPQAVLVEEKVSTSGRQPVLEFFLKELTPGDALTIYGLDEVATPTRAKPSSPRIRRYKRIPAEVFTRAQELRDQGLTIAQASKAIGISTYSVAVNTTPRKKES